MAESILKIALDTAKENNAEKIKEVSLIIGEMAGVETESLRFSFDLLANGTIVDGAKLSVKKMPLIAKCDKCGGKYHLKSYNFFCPRKDCDGILEIISGREMKIAYVEVD